MAYRLKEIKFKERPCHILLQNENGPCPLLAAANVLLLKDSIKLPSNCIGAGVVTIDQLLNVLAEKILINKTGSDHHIQEVMNLFPSLQFGMDVNPKFTDGPTGVEYTPGLDAFDLLHMEMVHGWLLDPQSHEFSLIEGMTYNQLVNAVIEGNDAGATLERDPNVSNREELSNKANEGIIIHQFLESSGHQLTQYGLTVLHEYLKDNQMAVFFRNNHFNSLLKHEGHLYLLVTDIGYARVGNIVWEKLDVIDGDTEFVNQEFKSPPPMAQHQVANTATGEQLVANDMQSQADYQLALQLSQETGSQPVQKKPPKKPTPKPAPKPQPAATPAPTSFNGETIAMAVPTDPSLLSEEERDRMIALQLHQQEAKEESMRQQQQQEADSDSDIASRNLAIALQKQEEQEHSLRQQQQQGVAANAGDDIASQNLAMTLQRQEEELQRQRIQQSNVSSRPEAGAKSKRKGKGGKDGDCVIM